MVFLNNNFLNLFDFKVFYQKIIILFTNYFNLNNDKNIE